MVEVLHAHIGVFLGRPAAGTEVQGLLLDVIDEVLKILLGDRVGDDLGVGIAEDLSIWNLGAVIVLHLDLID